MGSLRVVAGRGRWAFLAASSSLVMLPDETPAEVQDAVRSAMTCAGVNLESIVSVIPVRGPWAVDSFAVIRLERASPVGPRHVGPGHVGTGHVGPGHPGPVHPEPAHPEPGRTVVVVRGSAAVDLASEGGSRRFAAHGAEPWALAEFLGVTGLSAGVLPDRPETRPEMPADAEPLGGGARRGDRAVWSAEAEGAVENAALDDDDELPTTELVADAYASARPTDQAVAPDSTSSVEAACGPAFQLSINGAAPEPLDATVVIGRRPHARRPVGTGAPTASGRPPEVLITVPSTEKRVSSNHVEIATSGRTVVITDLRSTNGTEVLVDRLRRVRLRPGDSVVAGGSAIVEIGDGNVIRISPRDRGITAITT